MRGWRSSGTPKLFADGNGDEDVWQVVVADELGLYRPGIRAMRDVDVEEGGAGAASGWSADVRSRRRSASPVKFAFCVP
jgi:hypothetical protein